MNALIETVNPEFIEFEGMYYLEYQGSFYKGCRRCGGTGHYSHNGDHSRCYDCDNNGSAKLGEYISDNRADAEKWCHVRALAKANRDRKREIERLKVVAARDERVETLRASNPEVVALLQKVYDAENEAYNTGDYAVVQRTNPFLRTMAGKLFNAAESGLTANMVAAVARTAEQDALRAAKAAANPVVTGRVLITGVVRSAKRVETQFGEVDKIMVQDDRGFRVYGTLARTLGEQAYDEWIVEVDRIGSSVYNFGSAVWLMGTTGEGDSVVTTGTVIGRRVTFTATVEASKDDPSFGFFSRPVKGVWL